MKGERMQSFGHGFYLLGDEFISGGIGKHWGDALAEYNSECARGIVHTPEYDEMMARLQARFDGLDRV